MARLGYRYKALDLKNLMDFRLPKAEFVGLIFAPKDGVMSEIVIKEVYFNYAELKFAGNPTATQPIPSIHDLDTGLEAEPGSLPEFFSDLAPFGFAFFSRDELQPLFTYSKEVTVSGAQIKFGKVDFSETELTLLQADPEGPYFSFKIEGDMKTFPAITVDSNTVGVPVVVVGLPCPPFWQPFVRAIATARPKMLQSTTEKNKKRLLKSFQGWKQFMEEIRKEIEIEKFKKSEVS